MATRHGAERRFGPLGAWLLALGWLVFSSSAAAHSPGLSGGDYLWGTDGLQVTLSIARSDLADAWPSAIEGDGSWLALVQHEPMAKAWLRDHLAIRSDQRPCAGGEGTMRLDGDGVLFELAYDCPKGGGELAITAEFLRDFRAHHRHLLHLRLPDRSVDRVLSAENPGLTVSLPGRGRAHLVWLIVATAGVAVCLYLARRLRSAKA